MNIMNPWGLRSERRVYEQQYYGGYCNEARKNNLNPLPFYQFQDKLNEVLEMNLSKKERMKYLIVYTKRGGE
ncbi:hypothetical protein MOB65_20085 [Bacillus inaquosorum]|uniref:hypothetical protein n=1 Tax=Bacillus inaquosorum TaxID=483913 RepID=UPI00227FED6D|nr:hypothetical protein [Bacillus inaquosorum]MCY7911157.1 hypothetical protein [Bacillus inaquosorum]